MAQMELDYMQRVAKSDDDNIRCILTTDAEAAFQSAGRRHCCYEVLCSEATLKERFAPFFAHINKGAQRVFWLAANLQLRPSSGFTQGDVNLSKLFTCDTASLVAGLQANCPIHDTVVAIYCRRMTLQSWAVWIQSKPLTARESVYRNLPTTTRRST